MEKEKNPQRYQIIHQNRTLEHVKEMKFIGIYFNNRLKFYKAIEHITEKSR